MEHPLITAVTHSTEEARITLLGVPDRPGAAAAIFRALADAGCNVDTIIQNEPRGEGRDPRCEFTVTLDVVEPMGMESMVYFTVNGHEVCARVEPSAASEPGQPMRLYANLNHMHLIDPATDLVL